MATVQLIDGRTVENARLTDVKHVGEEGSRSATAHIGEHTYTVYNSIVDGFNAIWHEQIDLETYKMLGKKGIVEGTVSGDRHDGGLTDMAKQQYKVTCWQTALAPVGNEIDVLAESPVNAAIKAMNIHKSFAMGVAVVLSSTEQTAFYDVRVQGDTLTYSRTAVAPRQTDRPFVWQAESEEYHA